MRVIHAVRSDAFAGVERHVALLAAAQERAGHEVTVIGGQSARMRAVIGPGVLHVGAATTVQVIRALSKALRDPCDVIHVHMTAAEVAASLTWRARHVPVISTRHFAALRGSTTVTRWGSAVAARQVQAQIAISHYVAQRVEGTASVVHPGVPGQPDATPAGDREDAVLVVQRLEPEKDTMTAVVAFARSGLSRRGWRLDIAGDGALRRRLEAEVAGLDLGHAIRFLGHRNDVETLMQRSAVLMAPCPVEGLGMTVLEAMASGLPTVASSAGGHTETVGRLSGAALFAPGDADAAAELLVGLAADADARDRYGRELQRLQRADFTLAAQERATEVVYRSLL